MYVSGPEIAASVQRIFAAAEVPIDWDPVDVTPVKNADGTMGIPQVSHRFILLVSVYWLLKTAWKLALKVPFFLYFQKYHL